MRIATYKTWIATTIAMSFFFSSVVTISKAQAPVDGQKETISREAYFEGFEETSRVLIDLKNYETQILGNLGGVDDKVYGQRGVQ